MQNETTASKQDPKDNSLTDGEVSMERQKDRPFILTITRNGHMSEHVMDYAVNVAHRMQYGILAVHVDTLPFFKDRGKRSKLFAAAMRESTVLFSKKAASKEVIVEHLGELGKIGSVVSRLCHSKKRIEFVVIDKGIRLEEVTRQSPVPVFPVITTKTGQSTKTIFHNPQEKGVFAMSTTSRKRHVKNCFLFGALNAALYATIFTNQEFVMANFTKGGIYALMPVATVFCVSYLHGNFTSAFWSALGIEGSKKKATKKVTETVAAPRPDVRPRVQVNA